MLHPDGSLLPADILIEGTRIAAVSPDIAAEAAEPVDCTGLTLAPGFIDLHVHGGGGFSLITPRAEEIEAYKRWTVTHGVTAFLAGICADTPQAGRECLAAAASAVGPADHGAELLGVNLEGPFVSPARPGALPPAWLLAPSHEEMDRLLAAAAGNVRLITIAPELEGALALLPAAIGAGAAVGIGHTDATYEEARRAFQAGASHVTHAFNAMRPLHHREPGPLGAALEAGDVTLEVIADGVHLHPAAVRLLVRSFGPGRVCLVTDAVAPAGLASGVFRLGGREARLENGSIRLPDGTIAGSAATMDAAVRNVVAWGVASLPAAIQMASSTPARVLGLQGRKGVIAPGRDADIIGLSPELNVVRTWAGGRLAHAI